MKTTIIILGDNNFWYSTNEVEYHSGSELEQYINESLSEVKENIKSNLYETDPNSLTVVLGEIKYSNLSI